MNEYPWLQADAKLHREFFHHAHGRWPELTEPESYTEILLSRMLSPDCVQPLRQFITDKEYVKLYVRAKVGESYNVTTYAIVRSEVEALAIRFPDRCVIKPTHLSGPIMLLQGAASASDRGKLVKWLRTDHYAKTREGNYRFLRPKLIAEELLTEGGNDQVTDYKFYCFQGRPAVIQLDINRRGDHRRTFYSNRWQLLPCVGVEPQPDLPPPRPPRFDEMLELARTLSADFAYLRVDLYHCDAGVKVGELTNYPGGGRDFFSPHAADLRLGRLFAEPDLDVLELLS
jgi:hypothetical protein